MLKPLNARMTYTEFLNTIKVIKMLYGRDVAEKVFTTNVDKWYNLDSASLLKLVERKSP